MRQPIIKQAILILLACTFLQQHSSTAQTKPGFFYAVTSNSSKDTSWLFGTYHLINDSYLKELPGVLSTFKKAKTAVVEVIIDSSELAIANNKALLQNKKLSSLLSKGFADSLDIELKTTVGQGIDRFEPLKPITVMLTLSMVNLMKDNQAILKKYNGTPLDAFFVASNKAAGKPVIALETMNQQMDLLFNTISDEVQAEMLEQFLRNKKASIKMGNDLLNLYLENNIDKIYAIYQESLKASGDMDFLIRKRNNEWMKAIPAIINKQSSFIAVGALHLAGPNGLVEQLRKAGYQVTALNMK